MRLSLFALKQCTIIRFGFYDIRNNQGLCPKSVVALHVALREVTSHACILIDT